MPTSATDPSIRLVFVDETGAPRRWLLLDGDAVAGRGNGAAPIPPAARTVLAVPGDQVAIHWLDLGEGLAPAQAVAAARLRLVDASAEPLAGMHVAVGRAERGLAPAALVPAGRMQQWLAAAAAAGIEADSVVPAPMLLAPPEAGYYRRDHGALADFRGPNAAFAIEPELAEAVVGDSPTQPIGEAAFESRLGPLVADPALDLRQGAFARHRTWSVDRGPVRRIALFALVLALLTLVVQVATILAYTFAADRAETEAQVLAGSSRGAAGDTGPGFGAAASLLFEAIRATPNAELARIDYRADGTLVAAVTIDNLATLQALQGRIEASGLSVAAGQPSNAGGRLTAELTLRAG